MKLLFTICGRAGSMGVPNKNVRTLAGVPLVAYALSLISCYENTHGSDYCDVVVNTDNRELEELVRKLRPEVLVATRTPELANGTVGKVEVIRDSFLQVSKNKEYDLIIDLDITSPLRTLADLENLIAMSDSRYDVVFSVVRSRRNPFFNMVKVTDGYASVVIDGRITSRQQAPDVFDITGGMYSYQPSYLCNTSFLFDGRCGVIVTRDFLVLDIDHEEDLDWLEFLLPRILLKNAELECVYSYAKFMVSA